MLTFVNLEKSFGSRLLFNDVTFTLGSRDRIGLVGRNGHGKTTFLNMIVGKESADKGEIITPRGYKIGYLAQTFDFKHKTVRDEAAVSLTDDKKESIYIAEKILSGLGFSTEQMDLAPLQLSGGFQVRLNLAKLLLSEPNLLLLDEPTNYLDILSVRWLRQFLVGWQGELIIVTHDRSFMDSVVTHIVGIHRQKIRKILGGSEKYYNQIAKDEEIYEKTRINDDQKRAEMERFISRFRAKARLGGLVQSRVKTLSKLEKKDKLEVIEELDFSFRYKNIPSQTIIHVKNLTFGYNDEKPLFNNISFSVNKKDRICIIGKNGAGKSTLLRAVAGKLTTNKGEVLGHNSSNGGYFEQTHIQSLPQGASIEEEVAAAADYQLDKTAVRNICASMLFTGEDALKKIGVLSGGEKCRVMLAKILATPVSYLLLDEPTNHLDMDASDSLLEAIDEFEGGVVLVTHNEMFLQNLATKLIVFQGEEPFIFDGTYQEFLDKIGWQEDDSSKKSKEPAKSNKKEQRKARAELIAEKRKVLKPIKDRITAVEIEIDENEQLIAKLHKEIEEATSVQDGKLLLELSKKLKTTQDIIDERFMEYEELSTKLNEIEKEIDDTNE